MNLSSYRAPYVHSSIYRFNNQLAESSLDSRSDDGKARLQQQIDELKKVRDILKGEADAFLGGLDWHTIMNQLGQNEYKLREIAINILNSPRAIQILSGSQINYNRDNLTKAFPQLEHQIENYIDKNAMLTTREAIDLISKIILESIPSGQGNLEAWKNAFINRLTNSKGTIEKKITEQIKGKLTSEKGKVRSLVEQTLKSRSRSITKEKTAFIKYFEAEFRLQASKYLEVVSSNEIEEYLSAVIQNFRNLGSSTFTREISSMTGKLGEDFLEIVMNGNNRIDLTFKTVGMMSEDKMQKDDQINQLLNGAIKTHHKTSADSQTDLLITNNRTGKTIRAQSKNLQAAYQSVININQNSFPGMAKLQSEASYVNLISQLESTGTLHLSQEDLGNLSYLLANEIWFRANPSYGGSGKARGISDSSSILGQTVQMVNQLLTSEITNFIGITIDEAITINSAASSFNSFYLISNKILFPIYLVIDDLIKQLNRVQAEFVRLQVTLNTSKSPGGAASFYKAKIAAVAPDALRADGNYSDGNLVAVGTSKGGEIISNLSIRNIGLKFDIQSLLQTSWAF